MKETISSNKKAKSNLQKSSKVSPFGGDLEGAAAIITIVGVGLISGSFALAMKEKGFAKKIIGVSRTEASLEKPLSQRLRGHCIPYPT